MFWAGIWASCQPRFAVPTLSDMTLMLSAIDLAIPLLHLTLCLIFVIPGAWLAVIGVRDTTLKVVETHRPERVVTDGVYSHVRHPQYLGGLLSHVGISFPLSARFSLPSTPLSGSACSSHLQEGGGRVDQRVWPGIRGLHEKSADVDPRF